MFFWILLKKKFFSGGDTSQFVFNEQMGIYYNSKNGFYYDPINNYYWDSLNGVYFYFNEQTGKYAAADEKREGDLPNNLPNQQSEKPSEKVQKEQTEGNIFFPLILFL